MEGSEATIHHQHLLRNCSNMVDVVMLGPESSLDELTKRSTVRVSKYLRPNRRMQTEVSDSYLDKHYWHRSL